MDTSELSPLDNFLAIVEVINRMDMETETDTLGPIVGHYVSYFTKEVIWPRIDARIEVLPTKWRSGNYEVYTSASLYSDASEGEYSISIRIMDEQTIQECQERLDNASDGVSYRFAEIVLDLQEDGWSVNLLVTDLADPQGSSDIYAYADANGVEVLHPAASSTQNILNRIFRIATHSRMQSAYSTN